MTGYYLLDHQNPHGKHYYTTRKGPVLACVVHITAGLQDLDGRDDHSAENTARYAATTDRAVSWNSGSDTDSSLLLLPDSYTAFHCMGYNSVTIGHEISKSTVDWSKMPEWWVEHTLIQAANCLRPRLKVLGIPIRHATKEELDHARATGGKPVGLIDHSRLDPERRRDPGFNFPWLRFLGTLAHLSNVTPAPKPDPAPIPAPNPPEEEDMKHQRFIVPGKPEQYLATPTGLIKIRSQQHLALLKKAGLVADADPVPVTQADIDAYGIIG